MKKTLWPIFSRIIGCDKPQGTICKGAKCILVFTVELIREFFKDLRGCWKHKLLKKMAAFPMKKILWPIFSPIMECDKPLGTIYKGPQAILTITVELIRAFL